MLVLSRSLRIQRASITLLLVSGVLVEAAVTANAAPPGKTHVLCPDRFGDTVPYIKPRRCNFLVAEASGRATLRAAGEFYVNGMKWRHWGSRRSTASGTFRGNMNYSAKGTVTLSGLQRCSGSVGYVYTRFRMTFPHTRPTAFRLNGCA
jgi:hypothetical protein